MGTMDPTFNPVITDDSAAFSQKAVQAMEKERSQMQLDDSYQLLAQIRRDISMSVSFGRPVKVCHRAVLYRRYYRTSC